MMTKYKGTRDEVMAKIRLEYLREQIKKECISYGEIAELQSLAEHIDPGDVVLLELAGVPENKTTRKCKKHSERTRECSFYSFQNDNCSEK